MKNVILIVVLFSCLLFPQTYKVEKVNGIVKAQVGTSEQWTNVKEGNLLNPQTLLLTEKNSSVTLSGNGVRFSLLPGAALNVNSLRIMTVDELLLALATEEILSAPSKKGNSKALNTAIYGSKQKTKSTSKDEINLGEFRLNGAMQLAQNGYEASAVLAAKEAFRKYPSTQSNVGYMLYFAELISSLNLFEEAFVEYSKTLELPLNDSQREIVSSKLSYLKREISGTDK